MCNDEALPIRGGSLHASSVTRGSGAGKERGMSYI